MRSDPIEVSISDHERRRLLVESISDYAIYMLDPSGIVVNWNAGAQRFKGYAADEIVGQDFARFYSEEDRAAGMPARNLARAATEGRVEQEGWRIRKDGARFWAHVVIDRILDAQGRLVGFAKITRDLTERRLAQEQLRASQEQFRLLVQGVTDYALYMLDLDGNVASWNAGAERIKGYVASEIIGQHFSRFYGEEERREGLPQKGLETAMREGRFEREGWRYRKDGTRFWAHVIIDRVHDDAGTLVGFAKITRDITERKQAQEQLDRAREALFQSQKLEALGQLTGGVAHDFNNLLMAVLGSLDIVSRRLPHDPRITPFIENAIQGAQRGAALTQRMLAFARRQDLKMAPVSIGETVAGMGELLERSLGPSVSLVTRFPDVLPDVHTDRAQLESALLNLAVNARDAMPGGGRITISARQETLASEAAGPVPPGQYVVLCVRDEGEGMDADTLLRATEPFFTTKEIGKGTGLGLSMVQGLAEQSGGRLVLSSQPGAGTTAEVWLPLAGPRLAPPETEAPPSETGTVRKTVLTVDDDPLVLMNTAAMLEDLGHVVVEASSGLGALGVLEREHVDLVVTDHAMPQMTGAELAMRIRERWPDMPIIMATGYADLPVEITARHPVLTKPFRLADLDAAVASALSEGAGASRGAAPPR